VIPTNFSYNGSIVGVPGLNGMQFGPDGKTLLPAPTGVLGSVGDACNCLATPNETYGVNSMDEVPDSSWFTNRIGCQPLSIVEIARGPGHSPGPAPGRLTVIAGKSVGITPGFQVRDSAGQRYFVKFDPPSNPELSSAAEVISTRIFHALGYFVPDTHIAAARREDFTIGDEATIKGADGKKRPFTPQDLDEVLQRAARRNDGSYRFLASQALDGVPVGPFRYDGTRPDDPNDTVPHEHRRWRNLESRLNGLDDVSRRYRVSVHTTASGGHRIDLQRFEHGLSSEKHIPREFFDSAEYLRIAELAQTLSDLMGPGAYVIRGDQRQEVASFKLAMNWLFDQAKKGQSIQRYKGLGEMNADQLWDTTINPETRRLMQVRIEDAVAADDIFTTLMGDAVEPRREFIEKNALQVSNLDV